MDLIELIEKKGRRYDDDFYKNFGLLYSEIKLWLFRKQFAPFPGDVMMMRFPRM